MIIVVLGRATKLVARRTGNHLGSSIASLPTRYKSPSLTRSSTQQPACLEFIFDASARASSSLWIRRNPCTLPNLQILPQPQRLQAYVCRTRHNTARYRQECHQCPPLSILDLTEPCLMRRDAFRAFLSNADGSLHSEPHSLPSSRYWLGLSCGSQLELKSFKGS
jgi:hypothetical protein